MHEYNNTNHFIPFSTFLQSYPHKQQADPINIEQTLKCSAVCPGLLKPFTALVKRKRQSISLGQGYHMQMSHEACLWRLISVCLEEEVCISMAGHFSASCVRVLLYIYLFIKRDTFVFALLYCSSNDKAK